jgi:probable HAF family extracellular repeat protein
VGKSYTAEGDLHAFITGPNGAGMTDLGTLGGISSAATSINNAGQVAGFYNIIIQDGEQESGRRAFITGPGGVGMTGIRNLGYSSVAAGINSSGQVAGHFDFTGLVIPNAFATNANANANGQIIHFGSSFAGTHFAGTAATSINDAGQVVGWRRRPRAPL